MYRSLTLSDEQEGGQLLAAPMSIPGVYDYGQKYWEGAGFGTFTLCNNNNNNIMKEILPQTRHTIHFYGDKHDLFFPPF